MHHATITPLQSSSGAALVDGKRKPEHQGAENFSLSLGLMAAAKRS
jgi:hypothetical protein